MAYCSTERMVEELDTYRNCDGRNVVKCDFRVTANWVKKNRHCKNEFIIEKASYLIKYNALLSSGFCLSIIAGNNIAAIT